MKEREIIEAATHNLGKITGARFSIKTFEDRETNADAIAVLKFQNQQQNFHIEVKNEVRSFQLPQLIRQIEKQPGFNWILLAQYIPSTIKAELKEKEINYLEASGNCYIKTAGFYFFINDKKVTETRLPKEGKLWNPTGLKFLFVLLVQPNLINGSYRDIAKSAGIALGNVGPLLAELREEGFLKTGNSKTDMNFLDNAAILTNRWTELYGTILKPKLRIGRFRGINQKEDWQKGQSKNYIWGGENAGAILTKYLQPEFFTLYSRHSKSILMKEERLVPDPNGNIDLLQQFWSDELQQNQTNPRVVPPLLAFAELSTNKDSRNHETAERIKNQYLNAHV